MGFLTVPQSSFNNLIYLSYNLSLGLENKSPPDKIHNQCVFPSGGKSV